MLYNYIPALDISYTCIRMLYNYIPVLDIRYTCIRMSDNNIPVLRALYNGESVCHTHPSSDSYKKVFRCHA